LTYDSIHGVWPERFVVRDSSLCVGKHAVRVLSEANPANLPWKDLGVDVVLECTGKFTERDKAAIHLGAGARRVLVSAPAKGADAGRPGDRLDSGKEGRDLAPGSDARWLGDRRDRRDPEGGLGRLGQRRDEGGGGGAAPGNSPVLRGSDRVAGRGGQSALGRLRFAAHDGFGGPRREGARLVRQRVGVLQPHGGRAPPAWEGCLG